MQGRLEHSLKTQNNINNILLNCPNYLSDYYYNLAVSTEPKTCENYLRKIKGFLFFVNPDLSKIKITEINDVIISKYFISIQRKKIKENNQIKIEPTSFSYQKGVWTALNSFFKYLKSKKYIEDNPVELINRPKHNDYTEKYFLTADDLKLIINSIKNGVGNDNAKKKQEKWKERDLAIVSLFMNTGMRRTALSEINIGDVDFVNKTLTIIDKRHTTHVYPLNNNMETNLKKWIVKRKELIGDNEQDALFISTKRSRISEKAIYNLVQKYTEDALGIKLSPHKLRAAFCSILYEQTHDIEFVRKAVGHQNIITTTKYICSKDDSRKNAISIMEQLLS